MAITQGVRPGGRSARVQAAIHQAVRELEQEMGRQALTIPAIAVRAGVTPSTLYRRWGDLTQLLADVAVEKLRPDAEPQDTGSFIGDLEIWLNTYIEEMASEPGRAMLRDVLGTPGHESSGKCAGFTAQQLEVMRERALARQETPASAQQIIERIIAPLMYRILFTCEIPTPRDIQRLLVELATPLEKA